MVVGNEHGSKFTRVPFWVPIFDPMPNWFQGPLHPESEKDVLGLAHVGLFSTTMLVGFNRAQGGSI